MLRTVVAEWLAARATKHMLALDVASPIRRMRQGDRTMDLDQTDQAWRSLLSSQCPAPDPFSVVAQDVK